MISHRQRIEACLSGIENDRVPVVLWRHFPVDDQDPLRLARATLAFQRQYDFDLIKVSPQSSFCLKDYGIQDRWDGATEGTYTYTRRVIQEPEDWTRLQILDPYSGWLGAQLECLKIIKNEIKTSTPILQTIFNPLSQAKNLIGGEKLIVHLRKYPDAVHEGLKRITESTCQFIKAAEETGIDGIFLAVQHAQYGLLTSSEYLTYGKFYDSKILESIDRLWVNMLHLHGSEVMFDLFLDYPIQIINWHDQDTPPSLSTAKMDFPGIVCGGLRREETLVLGTPAQVNAEAQNAIYETGGQRFILGTGCVVPITAPNANLSQARKSVEANGQI